MPIPGLTVVNAQAEPIPPAVSQLLARARGLTSALIASDPEEPLPPRLLGIASRLHDDLKDVV